MEGGRSAVAAGLSLCRVQAALSGQGEDAVMQGFLQVVAIWDRVEHLAERRSWRSTDHAR